MEDIKQFVKRYNPKPKATIYYSRQSFHAKANKNIRLTFDTNVRYCIGELTQSKFNTLEPLLDDDVVLMEIKTINSLPLWMANELSKLKIFPQKFSKIKTCFYKHLISEGIYKE